MDTRIQQSNETLSIYLHVERVYPRPECSIVIGVSKTKRHCMYKFYISSKSLQVDVALVYAALCKSGLYQMDVPAVRYI